MKGYSSYPVPPKHLATLSCYTADVVSTCSNRSKLVSTSLDMPRIVKSLKKPELDLILKKMFMAMDVQYVSTVPYGTRTVLYLWYSEGLDMFSFLFFPRIHIKK